MPPQKALSSFSNAPETSVLNWAITRSIIVPPLPSPKSYQVFKILFTFKEAVFSPSQENQQTSIQDFAILTGSINNNLKEIIIFVFLVNIELTDSKYSSFSQTPEKLLTLGFHIDGKKPKIVFSEFIF